MLLNLTFDPKLKGIDGKAFGDCIDFVPDQNEPMLFLLDHLEHFWYNAAFEVRHVAHVDDYRPTVNLRKHCI